ncbi:MAG: hypothetical protein ABSF71_13515 [Terriglobia bacterium]|jgi:opacity protein-like surface antigen
MKKLIATVAILLMVPTLAPAQNADHPYRAEGYFFIGPIVSNTRDVFNPAYAGVVFTDGEPAPANLFFHAVGGASTGFGGEAFVSGGLALGGEVGYAGPDWSFSGGSAVGIMSPDVSYHFFPKKCRRVEPFATGGYSLYFGDRRATQSGFNFGGGVNLWVAKHAAVRLEVRNQGSIDYFHSQFTHYVAFRIGMTFR